MTSTTYNDIYMRDTLEDAGKLPNPSNILSNSPDIISQTQQVGDPATTFGTTTSWGQNPGKDIEYGQYNYLYVRCKNLGTTKSSGSIKLYWSKSSLLMFPSTWSNQGLTLSGGESSVSVDNVAPSAIAVGSKPFVWTPPENPAGQNWHYCLIGQVITSAHPNPIPDPLEWNGFVKWVRDHANICWRNLTIVDKHKNPNYDKLHLVDNATTSKANLVFMTQLKNFPVGTTIQHLCAPLNINASQKTTSTVNYLYSGNPDVPANSSYDLQVMITLPKGGSWPSNGSIHTTCNLCVDSANDIHNVMEYAMPRDAYAEALTGLGMEDKMHLVEVGNDTTLFKVQA